MSGSFDAFTVEREVETHAFFVGRDAQAHDDVDDLEEDPAHGTRVDHRGDDACGLDADLEDALKKSIDVVTTGSLKYNKDKAFLENLRKDRVLLYELS